MTAADKKSLDAKTQEGPSRSATCRFIGQTLNSRGSGGEKCRGGLVNDLAITLNPLKQKGLLSSSHFSKVSEPRYFFSLDKNGIDQPLSSLLFVLLFRVSPHISEKDPTGIRITILWE